MFMNDLVTDLTRISREHRVNSFSNTCVYCGASYSEVDYRSCTAILQHPRAESKADTEARLDHLASLDPASDTYRPRWKVKVGS